jgi:hypothetical protein
MADSIYGDNSGNIYVEADYSNIILVDPNKTTRIGPGGKAIIEDRVVDHENLVMYANLEASVLPRTKLAIGGSPQDNLRTISIAAINFLKPNDDEFLNTGYYDDLTGLNSNQGKARTQRFESVVSNNQEGTKFYKQFTATDNRGRVIDTGLLGITSIIIETSLSFIPKVTIELEDVQGKALFESGDQSPYAAFFNLPYPPFYLTVKGWYGQAIRYQLNLQKFTARFNTFSGNYQVSLLFLGYKYNILNELSIGHLIATPHMYSKTFNITQSDISLQNSVVVNQTLQEGNLIGDSTISDSETSIETVSEKGYQKIKELYAEYKQKGLIPIDFPELTVAEMAYKLQHLEQDILNEFKNKADLQPLTDATTYGKYLKDYFEKIRGQQNSWYIKYINPNPFILKNGTLVFAFKTELDPQQREQALTELRAEILSFNNRLNENRTFGAVRGEKNFKIDNSITINSIVTSIDPSQLDFSLTLRQQLGVLNPTSGQTNTFINQILKQQFNITVEITPEGIKEVKKPFFVFDGTGRFDNLLKVMQSDLDNKVSSIETEISTRLAEQIASTSGLGFVPTVRNVMAVIFASTEAFIRLMDEVHTKAWEVRTDPIRKNVIFDNSTTVLNSDNVRNVQYGANASDAARNSEEPVYPWPQVFVENAITPTTSTTNNFTPTKGRYELAYPGDPSIVSKTKGYLYDKWPEVEFVEEYLRGVAQKFQPPVAQPPKANDGQITSVLNINAIEFPYVNFAYLNKEEVKYFYEIYERSLIYSRYSGFVRAVNSPLETGITELIANVESNNIVSSLGISSPYLILKLKNFPVSAGNYITFLQGISNDGTGRDWNNFVRDYYVTTYLRDEIENSASILPMESLSTSIQTQNFSLPQLQYLKQFLDTTNTNIPQITDTYPFTDELWNATYLNGFTFTGDQNRVFNTTRTYKLFEPKNLITNFTDLNNKTQIRPVTTFSYLEVTTPNPAGDIEDFYTGRSASELLPTEGYVERGSPNVLNSTTSMLNTPFFVNAIQYGVENQKNSIQAPYKQAAFLFLNSLPLATLKERYKTLNSANPLDYIFASMKKLGAVHRLPYVWILKYGSIWHRYKEFVNTGQDILGPIWSNYDYINNYDPVNGDTGKSYVLNGVGTITLQEQELDVSSQYDELQIGFYPKTINDFNYFLNGSDLWTNYSDSEINQSIAQGFKIQNLSQSNIFTSTVDTTGLDRIININTYSCLVPDTIEASDPNQTVCNNPPSTPQTNYYVLPSFGTTENEMREALFNSAGTLTGELFNNPAIFNGSVRTFWKMPNYGYLDINNIERPDYDAYLNLIPRAGAVAPFKLILPANSVSVVDNYSKIDDLLSTFEKKVLDLFEREFLKFSQSILNFDPQVGDGDFIIDNSRAESRTQNIQNNTNNNSYRNFQLLFRELMSVPLPSTFATQEDLFKQVIEGQFSKSISEIQNLMNYDVALRLGNPTQYKRRETDSYLRYVLGTGNVIDPIPFGPYIPNTLPTQGGSITLLESELNNLDAWRALRTNVGFSTIPELTYSNSGSYITDFFIDNNIAFTQQNVEFLAPVIKMYATQKLEDSEITNFLFANSLQNYLALTNDVQNTCLNNTLTIVRKDLPNITELPEKTIQSQFDSKQSKVELYEMFKALNDKWISGSDFTNQTLFEDILFLDRASRNIGDKIILDIFNLQRLVNPESLNYNMSVFVLISGILTENHFSVMPMPAYVNFYNVQQVSASAQPNIEPGASFANSMWGTFLNVDYRNSGPKLVCFYSERPSTYLDLRGEAKNYLFRSDAFDLREETLNPLIEDQTNKQDWSVSNRVVGFNVDIGIRNQNVFYSFSVTQDTGKATSESIQQMNLMAASASGRNTSTQNVSLYNIYKNMSYQCEVISFGNALIQPTMYFNLRHVPLFNGSYMITEVQHTISPGTFQTKFNGIRQSVFTLPYLEGYLQSINKNLVTKLLAASKQSRDISRGTTTTTTQGNNANLSTDTQTSVATQNSCVSKVLEEPYLNTLGYDSIAGQTTSINSTGFLSFLNQSTDDENIKFIIFVLSFASTGVNNRFESVNNNYGKITLNYDYGATADLYFTRNYVCRTMKTLNTTDVSMPFAVFNNVLSYINFVRDRVTNSIGEIRRKSIETYFLQNWPYPRGTSQTTNSQLKTNLTNAVILAKQLGLNTDITVLTPISTPTPLPNNQNLINTVTPTCT